MDKYYKQFVIIFHSITFFTLYVLKQIQFAGCNKRLQMLF